MFGKMNEQRQYMKITTTLLFVLFVGIITSHAQTFEWAKSMGATNYDYGQSIAVDDSGNVYSTGFFSEIADFDPGPTTYNLTSLGLSDIFILKLDAVGNFIWAKCVGGISSDNGNAISVDGSGNAYVTGSFIGTADFDPGVGTYNLSSSGLSDIFILKLDAAGNFLWARSMGGIGDDIGFSIAVDDSGNVYTTGLFQGTADFDPGAGTSFLNSAGDEDIFISKLDVAGNFVWVKSMGGNSVDIGYSITADGSDYVYTTGSFNGIVDFDPSVGTYNLTSAGGMDVFILKMDASGNFLWAKSMGGAGIDRSNSIATDSSGNVYTTGFYSGNADFDPGAGTSNLVSSGGFDVFISKLDTAGNFLWAKSMGGVSNDWGFSIAVDFFGNAYITGFFYGTADFDPSPVTYNLTSVGNTDIFIMKLNAAGNFLWAKSIGETSYDYGNSIAVDGYGNVYITGGFQGTMDFDPGMGTSNITSNGYTDIYISKYSLCFNTTASEIVTACDSYKWIDGNIYTASNSTATHTLTNLAGCDSMVTLNLTFNGVSDLTTSTSGETITANNTSATYQWLDCGNNYAAISGETGQTFTATANGNYAVELTENGCVDTSACVAITTVGILENSFGNAPIIYPNPTKGEFSIDLGASRDEVTVIIRNLLGQEVLKKSFGGSSVLQLNIPGEAGMYLIEISSGDKKAIVKVVKE
jgi:hypothetical protein